MTRGACGTADGMIAGELSKVPWRHPFQARQPSRQALSDVRRMALVAKARAEAFEGRYFARPKAQKLLVQDAWNDYQPISKRDNDTWQTEQGRAKHLNRHLGQRLATALTLKDVDEYRTKRLAET